MNNTLILNPPFVIKSNLSLKWRILLRGFWVLSILSILFLLIFYIFQVNAKVSEKYLIQEYEQKLDKITKENKNLEISSIQTGYLGNIAKLLEGHNFEKTDKIHYIRVLDGQVVTR